jgi:hypothetical protein
MCELAFQHNFDADESDYYLVRLLLLLSYKKMSKGHAPFDDTVVAVAAAAGEQSAVLTQLCRVSIR